MDDPVVSVVVSTYRRAGRLPELIAALEAQTLSEPFEVVIVDNGSPDDTDDRLRRLQARSPLRLRPLRIAVNRGPTPARNAGWRTAHAALIAFTDDDCSPHQDWLKTLVAELARFDIVQGRTQPNPAQRERWGPFSRSVGVTSELGFYETCNIAYRRSVLERVGGFDETFHWGGEDTDLAWRARNAGATTRFAPGALVYHDVHPSRFRDYLRAATRWDGVVRVVDRHPQLRHIFRPGLFWRPGHAQTVVAAAGIAVLGIAVWRGSLPLLVLGAGLGIPYAWFRLRTRPLRARRPRRLLTLPLAFVVDATEVAIHLGTLVRLAMSRPKPPKGRTPCG